MDGVEQYPFDILLSYAKDDTTIADALINALLRRELKASRIEIGSYSTGSHDFYLHSKFLLENARHIVVLLSPSYLTQNYFELLPFQTDQLQQQKSRFTLLRLGNTPVPRILQSFFVVDLTPDDLGPVVDSIEKSRSKSAAQPTLPNPPDKTGLSPDSVPTEPKKIMTKEEWLKEGQERFQAGRYDEALKAFDEALKLDKDYPAASIWKRYALERLEEQKKLN